ncbi:MAG: hypothetical protein J6C51_06540 [Clostridia bacterium]|nr:hypothetical protein [Clostridia bacterium]
MEKKPVKNENAKFTLRVDPVLLAKFKYVAEYNARSANRELEMLMRNRVKQFETQKGKIEL